MTHSTLSQWSLDRSIPSDTQLAAAIGEELVQAMFQRGWPARDIFRVQLAYDEAVVNAIRHGNQSDLRKSVDLKLHCSTDSITIEITDQGNGFCPEDVPDPTSDHRLEVPGGRGVLLIRELMHQVNYNACGNQITMAMFRKP